MAIGAVLIIMDPISGIVTLILHFDSLLPALVQTYGVWIYLILFLIIFCETGLVLTPYLPGDSLLFVAGALAGAAQLNPWSLIVSLILAAVLGDSANYWIGHTIGIRFLEKNARLIRPEHLKKTEQYFKKYGGKTIVIARFIPVVRTIAPFLAGVGSMNYPRFFTYNIIGGIAWTLTFCLSGYFFGNIPVVRGNFSIIVFAIIGLSLIAVVLIMREVLTQTKDVEQRGE